MRLNFTAKGFVFGRINREIAPRTFSCTSQCENFQNASELHVKQLRFWTHNSRNCTQNFFYKSCRRRTSKMRLNFRQTASFLEA